MGGIIKYLITGGAGFIGSNLVDKIINKAEKVIVLDNLLTGNLKNLEDIKIIKSLNFTITIYKILLS